MYMHIQREREGKRERERDREAARERERENKDLIGLSSPPRFRLWELQVFKHMLHRVDDYGHRSA